MKYLAFLAAFACAAPPVVAPAGAADRIVVGAEDYASEAPLPAGPFGPLYQLEQDVDASVFLPDGRQIAVLRHGLTPAGPDVLMLSQVLEDRSLRPFSALDPPPGEPEIYWDYPLDLAVDRSGRLFLLTASGSQPGLRLTEVDPDDGSVESIRQLGNPYLSGLATAQGGGLWTFDEEKCLRRLDPDSGELGGKLFCDALGSTGASVHTADTDSAGRLYFTYSYVCSPPCGHLGSLDPSTGELRLGELDSEANPPIVIRWAAIERRSACVESPTARCLGGRFRAEIEFRAYDGLMGPAQATAARSADTAIFSFFDPDNWELMVKVLDGCGINQRFWVYSSASTDVEYTMTITDTLTGAEKVYTNPLGRIALTVTDNLAFACNP